MCEPRQCDKCSGSPCYIASGVYINDFTDLQIATGSFPIVVGRNYNSARAVDGPLGLGWASTLTPRLYYAAYLYAPPSTYAREIDLLMPDGAVEKFTDAGGGNFTPPPGRFDKLLRNTDLTWDLTLQRSRTVDHFNPDGTLGSVTDGFGNALAYTYTSGRLARIADQSGSGRYIDVTWGSDGRIADVADVASRHVRYSYASDGTLTTTTDALNHVTTMTYVTGRFAPLLQTVVDPWGSLITRLAWDPAGRLASYREGDPNAGGETYSYSYFPNGIGNDPQPRTFKTDSFGSKAYNFTSGGALITNSLNTYDPATGLLTSTQDGSGNVTSYTYDSAGRVLTVIVSVPPGGTGSVVWTYTYDPTYADNVATVKSSGGWAGYAFDYFQPGSPAPGALKKVWQFRTDQTTKDWVAEYTYDSHGRVSVAQSSDSGGTVYTYDAAGNLAQVVPPTGGTTNYGYDALGRITSVTDAGGHATTYAYDALDRVIRTTLPKPVVGSPLDFTTTITYEIQDFTGDPILYTEVRDPNGRVTRQGYDALGHLVRAVDALGRVTSYAYLHNVLASITDANENVTAYDYDNRRRLARTTFPDGQYETYAYSSDDRLVTKTDRKGTTFDYAYDAFGRVTGETARVNGSVQATRNWSYNGQNLTGMYAAGGGTTYTYDSLYRVLTETQTTFPQSTGAKITYTYPNIPNQGVARGMASYTVEPRIGTGYSPRVDYVYDGAGRVTDMQWSPVNGVFHIDYNANGSYSLITYPNGQLRSFAYDDQGRLTQVANTHPTLGDPGDLATFTYSYDHNWATGTDTMLGQRTSVTVTGSPAANQLLGETRYTYDANYQLIRAEYPGPNGWETWGYDAIGNRVARQLSGGTAQVYTYEQNTQNKNTQRLKTVNFSPNYVYDANGNQTGVGTATYYTWDVLSRLISSAVQPATYSYDATGRRLTRTASGTTTTFLYQGLNTVGEHKFATLTKWNDYLFVRASTSLWRCPSTKTSRSRTSEWTVSDRS